jgi:hypothetical protein
MINTLPDSAFLYIAPGGKKDGENKTVPRALRSFPYRDAAGAVDLVHLRNALARIPQSNVPASEQPALTKRAQALLSESQKAANYGARAGQTIAGNLARGSDGRFSRAGSGTSTARATTSAALEGTGVSQADADALKSFAKGGTLDSATAERLAAQGLVEKNADGTYKATSAGKALLRAVKKNDAGGARDAVNAGKEKVKKGQDAQAKRDAAAAQRASRQAAAQARRDAAAAKRAERDQARAAQQQQRNDLKKQKLTNRISEIQAKLDEGGLSDQQIEALNNRLEEYQAELDTLKGSALFVYKQRDGRYRWVTYSSNAFEDSDREIVSQKALDADTVRMDAERAYGPLRWWHVGEIGYKAAGDWTTSFAGPGVDLGACDFQAMHGRVLIESGTFRDPIIGARVKEHARELQVSIGFTHPIDEPHQGVFQNIRRFERSLLPRGKAANPFTGISVIKENGMNQAKELALKALLGDDYGKVAAVLAGAETTEKAAEDAGVRFKDATPPADAVTPPAAPTAAPTVGETTKAAATAETKADAPPAPGAEAAPAEDEGADLTFIGDMTPDEFTALMVSAMSQALAPLMEAMGKTTMAMSKAIDATSAGQKEAKDAKDATGAAVAALDRRVKELEGDAPKAGGFRASTDATTVKDAKVVAPQSANELQDLAAFWVSGPKQ